MKIWSISVGGLEKIEGQPLATHIHCEDMPWYCYIIEQIQFNFCCWPIFWWGKSYTLHDIPLPTWPSWIDKEDGEKMNLNRAWGDFGCLIHYYLLGGFWQWSWKKAKCWSVPVAWVILKPNQDEETIKFVEESFEQHIKWEKEEAEENATLQAESNNNTSSSPQQPEIHT